MTSLTIRYPIYRSNLKKKKNVLHTQFNIQPQKLAPLESCAYQNFRLESLKYTCGNNKS